MDSRTALLWALLLAIAVATAAGKGGAGAPHAHRNQGDGGVAAQRSDSGRSLLPPSEQADDDVGLLEHDDDDIVLRGMEAGLAPWAAQVHLAVQQEYRRLSLPMLACRSRFIPALRAAGPEAQQAVSAALQAGRTFLDRVVEDALVDTPLTSEETDAEISAIQASLAAGQRYPAGDILEARWRRAVRLSRSPADDGVLDARARVRSSAQTLTRVIGRELRASLGVQPQRVSAADKETVTKLWKCLQHRLLPLLPPRDQDDEQGAGRTADIE